MRDRKEIEQLINKLTHTNPSAMQIIHLDIQTELLLDIRELLTNTNK